MNGDNDTGYEFSLPSQADLCQALRTWREQKGMTREDVVANSHGKLTTNQLSNWEKCGNFSYKQLVEQILPAYQIVDFDLFIDFCRQPKLEQVRHIKHLTVDRIADGTDNRFVRPRFLNGHRTRLDLVEIRPGSSTYWKRHDGHEFVYVLRGKIHCTFAESREGPTKEVDVSQGQAVAFHSGLFHKAENRGNTMAILAAARPSGSRSSSEAGPA